MLTPQRLTFTPMFGHGATRREVSSAAELAARLVRAVHGADVKRQVDLLLVALLTHFTLVLVLEHLQVNK